MFTGIIQRMGTVRAIESVAGARKLSISVGGGFWDDVETGDSIAVNGTCLTVVQIDGDCGSFNVLDQTVATSASEQFKAGVKVNLEKALAVGQRMGGHIVSGHVDCRAVIIDKYHSGADWVFKIGFRPQDSCYIIDKGSVAIDGISLTVSKKEQDAFQVNIIPHTIENTTLEAKKAGDGVNLEFDVIGKYVVNCCGKAGIGNNASGLDIDFLKQNGFA